jgi:membrane protein implicated in regulation of membrane protease activity
MVLDWNWALLIVGAALILVEVALGGFAGFDLVLIGSAFVLAGALGMWLHAEKVALIVGGVLCLAYLGVGRRWVRRRIRQKPIPSNADAVLGQAGVVTARIAKHQPGRVKVLSEEWLASPAADASGPFEEGTIVTVEAVEGVTLKVR